MLIYCVVMGAFIYTLTLRSRNSAYSTRGPDIGMQAGAGIHTAKLLRSLLESPRHTTEV